MVIVWLLLGFIAWIVIGAAILSAMDDERQSLLQWAKECPVGGAPAVMLAWPVVVWWIWRIWRSAKHDQ